MQRVERLRRLMAKSGADGLLVTNFVNVTYLTGFTGDDSYLLVCRDGQVLVSDTRYQTQLGEECPELDIHIRDSGTALAAAAATVIGAARIQNLAVESDSMTIGLREQLERELPATTLRPVSGLVEGLREIKDRHEIAAIRRSIGVAERAFQVIRAAIRPDLTERRVANELEYQIRLFGGTGCSFPPIVAVGDRAALPHAQTSARRMDCDGFVLIDWGAMAGRYASDLTRLVVTSRISPKLERIYRVVLTAQLAAISAIRPGISMQDVDAAARKVISDAGFGRRFGHGLGHGIGLEIHEAPRLARNQPRLLRAGMVVTVEPGIYLPGWGGVRIEDDVLVTRHGHEVLSTVPKDLESSCIPI